MKPDEIKTEIVLISKQGGWAKVKTYPDMFGRMCEDIELSIDRPFDGKLKIVDEPKERVWP